MWRRANQAKQDVEARPYTEVISCRRPRAASNHEARGAGPCATAISWFIINRSRNYSSENKVLPLGGRIDGLDLKAVTEDA